MLFGHRSVQEASLFKSLLTDFSEASGTSINTAKSHIYFFHTPPVTQFAIARILGFIIDSLPSKYLGAPLIASALKHASWRILLEKIESRLSLWTHRSLNIASRLVLIKAVLQSMPLYLFSILAAPKWVIKKIKSLQRNFLWGATGTHRKWALLRWTTVCKPKEKGGIGLRDPSHSNSIMCAKIWEGQLQDEVWQNWTQDVEQGYRQWKNSHHIIEQADNQTKQLLEGELQNRPIRCSEDKDILYWGYTPRGSFTTKEAYKLLCLDSDPPNPIWSRIWTPGIWTKVSRFLWLVGHRKILNWDNLKWRNFHGPSICANCKDKEETFQHLLATCPLAKQLWDKVSF
eukprot:PITA_33291